MSIANRIRFTTMRSRLLTIPALACISLFLTLDAANAARPHRAGSRPRVLHPKSFGPGAKTSRSQATAECLPESRTIVKVAERAGESSVIGPNERPPAGVTGVMGPNNRS